MAPRTATRQRPEHEFAADLFLMPLAQLEAMLQRPAAQAWIRARAARLENGFLWITARLLRELHVDVPEPQ